MTCIGFSISAYDIILWRTRLPLRFGLRGWERGASLTVLSRGFSGSPARAASSPFFIWVHSQREKWVPVPRPTCSLTARVLRNSESAPPQVSIRGVCSSPSRVRQSSPETAHLVSHRLVSAEPSALDVTRPSDTPRCFPMSDARRVYLVDSFIAYDP